MRFSSSLLLLAALESLVEASATVPKLADLKRTNRVHQVAAGKKPHGAVAYANALKKYGKAVPARVLAASGAAVAAAATTTYQTAKVSATDLPFDRQYLINVTVGSTKMLLNLDTGSSDLWVDSTKLPTSERGKHKLYPLSGTVDSGETFSVAYGEGSSVSGVVYVDKVAIGGVTATVQAVEAATAISSSFVTGVQDGIVGMGFIDGNTCSPNSCYGFMHQAASVLPRNIFTATLRHGAAGEYDFGFIDHTKYTGALSYVDVVDFQGAGYWEFFASGYSVGSGAEVSSSIDIIADTGTSLLLMDDNVINAYWGKVTGAVNNATVGGIIFPCTSTLPNFSIWINGIQHTMPGAYANYAPLSSPKGYCFGGIQSQGDDPVSIIGDVFLKSQFLVFDVCLRRIGWAQQAGVKI